jgi:asparagine synthase (glutamine-hydrolysing)
VVALMAGASKDPVKTCSIAFNDPRFDESAHAQAVSDRYRTQHHVRLVDPDDFSVIDALPRFYDEPFADSSALPTYRVCQIAREQVTVALSGDGGDESLAGYRRYLYHMREQRVRGLLPHWLRAPIFGFLGRVYPKLDWAPRWLRGKTTFQALARDDVQAYFHSVSVLKDDLRRKLYSAGMHRQLAGYNAVEVLRRHAARAPSEHPLSLVQYLDFKTYLVGDILVKVDRASMAHSLEVRAPLLDARLVEWISGLSPDLKLRGAEGKYLFKKALEPLLPRDVLYRQKMGFAVPLISWFRGPLRERVRREVLGQRLLDTGFFERRSVEQLVEQHVSGFRDHSGPLWSLMMFARFLEHAESWPRWSPAGAALAGAVSGRSGAST